MNLFPAHSSGVRSGGTWITSPVQRDLWLRLRWRTGAQACVVAYLAPHRIPTAPSAVSYTGIVLLSETVTLVMTEKGMNSLLSHSVKLGGDANIAAGPIGAGANSDVTTDFVAFSRSKGIYGGLNLEGSVIAVANDWNRSYYGADVLPPDILVRANAHNAQADHLASMLDRAIRTKTSSAQ
jgi:SH3 domain-containing YSC84-like protein 1